MLRSLRTAEAAMHIEQLRVDTLANNLANVDTDGFRQVLMTVQDAAAGGLDGRSGSLAAEPGETGEDGVPLGLARPARNRAGEPGGSPALPGPWPDQAALQVRQILDPRPGVLRATGRSTDLALLGPGYFAVETAEGERFTRSGAFRLDAQSRLVTASGEPVLGEGGPIRIEGGRDFTVGEDGSVQVDGTVVSRLRVVDFAEPMRLEHRSHGLLSAPADLAAEPVERASVRMMQGQLESSNVDPIDTLVDMIAAQRAFEVASRVVQSNDDLLEKSVNQLPRSR
ncbi:MAG: flagellar hook-basal body protein [Candidatus Krumholzibacteriia bacterium]